VAFWVTVGLVPQSAKALAGAGYRSLPDLAAATREQLLAIPGVGPAALAVLEEVLDRPLPRRRKPRLPAPRKGRVWPEDVWSKRGLPPAAAVTFAMAGMSLERLATATREELLALVGVGPASVRLCELMIGKPIPSREPDPVTAFWRNLGIRPQPARALSQAGIASLADLRQLSREDLLAVRGLSVFTLSQLEALLGSVISSRTDYWLGRGLPLGFAHVLVREGILTLTDLAALSREQFLALRGLGRASLWRCERLLGHKLPSRKD
jgi:predicted flap endonuclease-1-like 5' DNA nuclease